MPNSRNVESPISLVGLGRSGTTVLQAAFGRHPAVQVCGETFGIISSLWAGSMTSFLENDFLHQAQSPLKQDEKAAHYIRACMCALCPGERPHWFHKPIGMPKFLNWKWLPGDKSPITNFPTDWYWQVLDECFPRSTYITTVRSPWDVLLSRQEFSGWSLQGMALDVEFTYELYERAGDRIQEVVFFDDLVDQPEDVLRRLCKTCDLDFRREMMQAFDRSHAAVKGRGPKRDHRERWSELKGLKFRESSLRRMSDFWKAHGRELEIPEGLRVIAEKV